jgi:hypothetical protein
MKSIKDLHSFVRDNSETDSKLLIMGITGKPQVIHNLISYGPMIGSKDNHKFFGLCSNDPMGANLRIPTEFLQNIINLTPIPVPDLLTILTVNSAQEFRESMPTVPIPAEESKEANNYDHVLMMWYKYVLPSNYVASIVIKEKLTAEDKAFPIIHHIRSFNQRIVNGQAQGVTQADHPLLCENSRSVLSVRWLIANKKIFFPTLFLDPSDDVTKTHNKLMVLRSGAFLSIFDNGTPADTGANPGDDRLATILEQTLLHNTSLTAALTDLLGP